MFRRSQNIPQIRRSSSMVGLVAAAALISLIGPTAAQASSSTPILDESQIVLVVPDELIALSEKQISAANSGTDRFSTADLLAKVKVEIEADRVARDLRLAEEAAAAQAKAEEDARIAAEAAAAAEAERLRVEAEAAAAAEAERIAKQSKQSPSSPSTGGTANPAAPSQSAPAYSGGGSKDDWLRASGIAESDWGYVEYIVNRESSWNPNAVNKSSGASGLVQALPCGKVPGSCFNPVDNLTWADKYATDRYGSWAQAFEFWKNNHWW